jgi:hypothetical protein
VKIPIPQFFTSDWQLSGAERIYFNSDPLNRHCMVDNLLLRENIGPRVLSVEAISQSHIKIVMNKYYKRTDARQVDNYQLTDSTITHAPRKPKSIGLSTRYLHMQTITYMYMYIWTLHKIDLQVSKVQRFFDGSIQRARDLSAIRSTATMLREAIELQLANREYFRPSRESNEQNSDVIQLFSDIHHQQSHQNKSNWIFAEAAQGRLCWRLLRRHGWRCLGSGTNSNRISTHNMVILTFLILIFLNVFRVLIVVSGHGPGYQIDLKRSI